jgi:hypothetical protein
MEKKYQEKRSPGEEYTSALTKKNYPKTIRKVCKIERHDETDAIYPTKLYYYTNLRKNKM